MRGGSAKETRRETTRKTEPGLQAPWHIIGKHIPSPRAKRGTMDCVRLFVSGAVELNYCERDLAFAPERCVIPTWMTRFGLQPVQMSRFAPIAVIDAASCT